MCACVLCVNAEAWLNILNVCLFDRISLPFIIITVMVRFVCNFHLQKI